MFRQIFILVFLGFSLVGCKSIEHRSENTQIPVSGSETKLATSIFYPKGQGPFPVAVLNHGTPSGDKGRRAMGRWNEPEPINALVDLGFAVVVPMRRGFGATGGRYNGSIGGCSNPDFYNGSLGAAEDIVATVNYVKSLPQVDSSRILLIGFSAGGIASMAAASMQPEGVKAVMNFSGGRGSGRSSSKKGVPCYPERMASAIGIYAKNITVPVLWYYAENDSFFGPEVVKSWFASFQRSGAKGELAFHQGPSSGEGHYLIKQSGRVYGSY